MKKESKEKLEKNNEKYKNLKVSVLIIFIISISILIFNQVIAASTIYKKSSDTILITVNGTDSNYWTNTLAANKNSIKVYVAGQEITGATINSVTVSNLSNGTGIEAVISITGVTGDGLLTLQMPANTLEDYATNYNDATTITTSVIVDNTAPTTIAPTATSDTKSVTVTNKQADTSSGIKKIEYSIYKNSAWSSYQTSNVFSGLTHNTTYYVRTRATDNAGNISVSSQTTIATKQLTAGTLTMRYGSSSGSTYTSGTWTNNSIYVSLNQATYGTSTYYSTSGSSQSVSATSSATTVSLNGETGLLVKTTDGTNTVYSSTYYIRIDKIVPTAEIAPAVFTAPGIAKNKSFNTEITLKDTSGSYTASGLDYTNCKYFFSTQGTAYGITSSSWTSGKQLTSDEQTISLTPSTGSSSGTAYYIHCLVTDTAGNSTEIISNSLKSYIFWYSTSRTLFSGYTGTGEMTNRTWV